ncbi:hypothetical protein IIB34_08750, partial [PVC group bacterium]|nr:hypothetical protein [PVC group bacterium]
MSWYKIIKAKHDKEKNIVLDEINRYDNDNWSYFYRQLYNKCHAYSIVGDAVLV